MPRPPQLETFDQAGPGPAAADPDTARAEEQRLAAFDQGYRAGWDDAVAAQDREAADLRAGLGRSLADMTLSHHDARRHLLAAIEPLFSEMVAKVLPMAARHSLGAMILDEIRPAAAALADAPVEVRTAPANRDLVERLLAGQTGGPAGLPLRVLADDTLDESQAHIRVGEGESALDLGQTVAAIGAAVASFFDSQQQADGP
ncbi:MAG: flagellar biosynthesis protein [Proteobacteria bacterium]|nr:flagellar biosynthesis protein [Pseudomonadota bacterium]MBS0571881.1 flagellar biosynthesis protein [Pseudomonadota bacterium]